MGDLKYCLARVEVEQAGQQLAKSDISGAGLTKAIQLLNKAAFDYEEATIADPSVAASYVDKQGRSSTPYYQRINEKMLERFKLFAKRTTDISTIATEKRGTGPEFNDQLVKTTNTLLSYALNDYGNACLNFYVRFAARTAQDKELRNALTTLEDSVKLHPSNFMTEYNLFSALTWTDNVKQFELANSLMEKGSELFPAALTAVVTRAAQSKEFYDLPTKTANLDTEIANVDAQIANLDAEINQLKQQIPKLEPNVKKPGEEERTKNDKVLAQKRQGLSEKERHLTQPSERKDNENSGSNISTSEEDARTTGETKLAAQRRILSEKKQRLTQTRERLDNWRELEKPVLHRLRKTRLAPFVENLSSSRIRELLENTLTNPIERHRLNPSNKEIDSALCSRIGELLENLHINPSVFGDEEFYALAALAQVWALSDAPQASRKLCKDLLKFYSAEDFDLNQTLSSVTTEPSERQRLDLVLNKAIDWALSSDPKSQSYKYLRLNRSDEAIFSYCKDWPYQFSSDGSYQKAIDLYEDTRKQCEEFPAFHYSLSFAYEYRAKQLAANADSTDSALENSKLVLRERREACKRDPENQEYRDTLRRTLGRQLIAGNTFEDPFEQRTVPKLIEVEFATKSIPDLGFTQTGLSAELLQAITDVRTDLKTGAGFTLPAINFRDNYSFETGQYRFLIRGVPLHFENLNPETPQKEQFDQLKKRIKEVALEYAARLYTSEDCYRKLRELTDTEDIQNHSESLFALTWVLKALLNERVPISDSAFIVAEYRRCRSLNLSLVSTVEEIRSIPRIRKQLQGNSLDRQAVITVLNQDLENRIYAAIDWDCSEPIINSSPEIRKEVYSLALKAKIDAGSRCAVLLTTPGVRPFARKMIEGIDVNVLSVREILPILSHIQNSDAAHPT